MIIAVDTGGTKTLVASFETGHKAIKSHRFPTPKNTEVYIDTLAQLILKEYDLKKVSAIALASRGFIEKNVVLHDEIILGWQNFKIVDELKQKLHTDIPIFLENDANLAGLAEVHSLPTTPGAGLYVTISTGIGTGIITNGIIDPHLRLSEGGKSVLEFDGLLRSWESFASGSAIYETYGKYAHDIKDIDTWEAIADKISRGLLALIPLLQPEVVVIGGSIGIYFSQYEKVLKKRLKESFSLSVAVPKIIQAQHPNEAVLYGCHIYAKQQLA